MISTIIGVSAVSSANDLRLRIAEERLRRMTTTTQPTTTTTTLDPTRCFDVDMDRAGNDIVGKNPVEGVSSALSCQGLCAAESGCVAFTFQASTGKCWLKSSSGTLSALA